MAGYKGFQSVELQRPNRSNFDFSHERRLSTRMGRLTPINMVEVLPGDSWRGNSEVMLRLAPLLAPIMHRVNVYVHNFFIPNRLLWDEFEDMITNGRLGTETPPVPPNCGIANMLNEGTDLLDTGSLADYLGIPPIPDADVALWDGRTIDLMPFAAYYKCWYDYYRDRNFVDDNEMLPLSSGSQEEPALLELRTRAWEHDYFTSAQTNTQRGAEVLIPMEGSGDVTYLGQTMVREQGSNDPAPDGDLRSSNGGLHTATPPSGPAWIENIDEVQFTNSSVSVNDLRRAVALQKWLERNQLSGSRMNETILAHYGVRTSDSRLQRAEYLGGGKVKISISEVVTTAYSEDDATNNVPPGNMAGHGIGYGNQNGFNYRAEEWGFIVSILSIMPTSAYMQGIPRMFTSRGDFLSYPWPTFAHLGEQEVYKDELYFNPANYPADRSQRVLFGYQSRYVDWKQMASSSHGDFRTNLDFWHLTRKFSDPPVLGNDFVTFEDALQDRIFAVSGVDTLWCYIYNNFNVKRALPYFGTPKL